MDVKIQAAGDSKLNDRPDKVIHVAVQVVQGIANLHHACAAFFNRHTLLDHSLNGAFQGQWKQKQKLVKNPNWLEADQLAIYKRGGVEFGTTEDKSIQP